MATGGDDGPLVAVAAPRITGVSSGNGGAGAVGCASGVTTGSGVKSMGGGLVTTTSVGVDVGVRVGVRVGFGVGVDVGIG